MNEVHSRAPLRDPSNLTRSAHLVAARAWQTLGWPGMAGAALIVSALLVLGAAWRAEPAARADTVDSAAAGVMREADARARRAEPPVTPRAAPLLPRRSEAPLLLKQIAEAALDNGLGWPAAEYVRVPATADQPASLEVRCTLKGSYPALRSMLVQVLSTVPAATLRELALSRSTSDVAEVDAKLVFAVLIDDEAAPPATPAPQVAQ